MIFSQTSKYAIRALLHLAQHGDQPHRSRAIAQALTVPEPFLAKILQALVRHGLLLSFKGRGGGFKLARAADRISVYEIMSKPVLVVEAEMDIKYAIRMLVRFGLSRALVTEAGKLVGIVTMRDMVLRFLPG